MPRGADHRNDSESDRDFYRKWDVEDLTRIIGWMREAGQRSFTANEVKQAALYATVVGWGIRRIRRVVRVGVEIGWLQPGSEHRYEITEKAVATLPPFAVFISRAVADTGIESVDRDAVRDLLRKQLKHTIGST